MFRGIFGEKIEDRTKTDLMKENRELREKYARLSNELMSKEQEVHYLRSMLNQQQNSLSALGATSAQQASLQAQAHNRALNQLQQRMTHALYGNGSGPWRTEWGVSENISKPKKDPNLKKLTQQLESLL